MSGLEDEAGKVREGPGSVQEEEHLLEERLKQPVELMLEALWHC